MRVRVISALEAALDHMHNGAREPVAAALGELGSVQTFHLLCKRLAEGIEPSRNVVKEILCALVRLAERGQIDSEMTVEVIEKYIQHHSHMERGPAQLGLKLR